MKRHHLLAALAVVPVSACAREGAHSPPVQGPRTRVGLATVHEEPLPVLYRASGTIRGRNTAVLTSKTMGYVKTVAVRAGDMVDAGQVLAELEANDSRAAVARVRAGLAQSEEARAEAEGAVDAAHVAAELAKSTHARVARLLASQAVTQQQYDEDEARWRSAIAQENMARARLRAVASNIDEAKAALAESKAALGYSTIVAPFAGRIVERRIDPGGLASPGTPLLVLSDETRMRVEAAIEESRAPDVKVGDEATVDVVTVPGPLTGKVGEVVPNVDIASRSFLVKIDLPEDAPKLRPGTFARVSFPVGARSELVVPTTSVTSFGALDRVFVVERDRARLRMITRGEEQGPWTRVLSGLSENERVVAAPARELEDGSLVEVVQ